MLCNVPVIDGSIWVASRKHLYIARAVLNVWLTIVDVVLVKGLLRHHHCVSVELGSIKENCATTESIVANSCSLGAAEAWVE